ncbi:hypothetical protein [Streptomyces hyaluromycini]|uniref:hypothetical protein n=1 Tax=Streptomyces hyaluromycini TaxID=1377993 RepID=UPI000B5C5216|nr:hypothetical protein [Streptomyces hyaluromycini]
MDITPVITTLVGAGFGSFTTALVALSVQRATLKRERQHKLWERQVAVIEESLKYEREVVRKRHEAMRNPDGDLFLALNEVFKETDMSKISANLELYGTPAMRQAHDATFAAFRDWIAAFIGWQGHHKRTGPGHEEAVRAEAARETTRLWPEVEKLATKADETYDDLVKVMRATAIFEQVVSRVDPANPELPT